MSNYTTQVRTIIENCSVDNLLLKTNERIEIARSFIFDFDYPIWNEEYRKTLETKIIKHYYTKEIGLETVGLWKFYLEERLNLIMPYYNNVYATTVKDYDYLTNVSVTETLQNTKTSNNSSETNITDNSTNTTDSTQADSGGGTTTSTDNNSSNNLKSDTPQANYNGLDYASELNKNTETKNNTTNINNNNTTTVNKTDELTATKKATNTDNTTASDNYTKTNKGNSGNKSFTELLLEYRDSLINIDSMIIEELKDLFMSIY